MVHPNSVALGALILAAAPLAAQQSAGGVLPAAIASPERYAGNCPARIEFVGHVTVTLPGTTITYRWERSTGDSSKLLRAQIGVAAANRDSVPARVTVAIPSDFWYVSRPGRSGQFWEVLHVESPVDVRSRTAYVSVDCRE